MADTTTPIDRADLLVGRFFRLLGAIETELNDAIRKLFELPPNSAETVCANIDFFKKMNVVRSALYDQDVEGKHSDKIKELFNRIAVMNDRRQIAAHSSFDANGSDGVVFSRITARNGLERTTPTWTEEYCSQMFAEMEDLRKDLHSLAQTIAPYHPSLDFSDARNSMYLASI
jgi:hypothetical protein